MAKPKRQQFYAPLQLVRESEVLHVIVGLADGSGDLSMARRPVDCKAQANAILRLLQPQDDELLAATVHAGVPMQGPTTKTMMMTAAARLGGVVQLPKSFRSMEGINGGAGGIGGGGAGGIGVSLQRLGSRQLQPQAAVAVAANAPIVQQAVPIVRSAGKRQPNPYARLQTFQRAPPRQRNTISEVSIDTHSVSTDSFLSALPPPRGRMSAPQAGAGGDYGSGTDIYGDDTFSMGTSEFPGFQTNTNTTTTTTQDHQFSEMSDDDDEDNGTEYLVDAPTEVEYSLTEGDEDDDDNESDFFESSNRNNDRRQRRRDDGGDGQEYEV